MLSLQAAVRLEEELTSKPQLQLLPRYMLLLAQSSIGLSELHMMSLYLFSLKREGLEMILPFSLMTERGQRFR